MINYLISLSSTNKIRCVIIASDEIWDEERKGFIITRTTFQYKGKRTEQPDIVVNRAKQKRTFKEQLELEYNSNLKKYLDKGYKIVNADPDELFEEDLREILGDNATNQEGVPKPMLAKQEDKVTNRKIFEKEWYASRKIDGTRCLLYWDGNKVRTASRGGNNYDHSTTHITEHPKLIEFFETHTNWILDGELYKHGKSLQQISGAARMEKNAYDCDWLEFYLYDIVDVTRPFRERLDNLGLIVSELNLGFNPEREWKSGELQMQIVPQELVSGWNNMMNLHNTYVSEGWEGLVIRDPDRMYKPNGRTNDMIKIKSYSDATYKVIGYELGLRGSEDMCFICEMKDGRTFKAMPIGNRETKEEYVTNFDLKYKGHLGDCKYFTYSDSGIPTQPKFKCFRYDLE